MSSLERRLERLEAGVEKSASRWQIPFEVLVYTKMCERYRARTEGKEPPEYSWEEILEMRRQDLETVAGNGAEASLRDSIAWQTPEVQQRLDSGRRTRGGGWRRQRTYRPSAGERCGEWTKKSRRWQLARSCRSLHIHPTPLHVVLPTVPSGARNGP